jgi:hypothetical protein
MKKVKISLFRDSFKGKANNKNVWYVNGRLNEEVADIIYKNGVKKDYDPIIKKIVLESDIKNTRPDLKRIPKNWYFKDFEMSMKKYHLMFVGLAIECYLKCLYIMRNGPVANEDYFNDKFSNHNISLFLKSLFGDDKEISKYSIISDDLKRVINGGKYEVEKKRYLYSYMERYSILLKYSKKLIELLKKRMDEENKLNSLNKKNSGKIIIPDWAENLPK